MTSRYYAPGAHRSERVRELFSRIASRYDLINDVQSVGLHRLWKRRLVRAAAALASHRVLDVCCGTGDVALRFLPSTRQVVGCDFTRPMLEAGARRHGAAIQWVHADALELPFPDASFDVVTIAYGLRNLSDFNRGISELLRVLRPGGQLLILDFGKPPNPILRALYFSYLRLIVPAFGLIFCGDPAAYRYILDSLKNYPAQEGVSRILRQAGIESIELRNLAGGAMSLHHARKPN
jgi:demethylmenaquinone methyltransferase/2-methoxy-6-polyprenyl-1,4-benzoquinol methylase